MNDHHDRTGSAPSRVPFWHDEPMGLPAEIETTDQLSEIPGRANWLAAELVAEHDWYRSLTDEEIAALDAALAHTRGCNPTLDLAAMTAADFPIGAFAESIVDLRRRLIDGRGVMAWEGFPVERYEIDELRTIWWGVTLHLGTPVSQSWRGDLIGDVRDLGTGITGRVGRGYTSNVELGFHCDAADVTGLFVLRQGATGGVSRICSAVAVHNEIYRRRPDLLELLYQPFTVSCQNNELPGTQPWYDLPVFGRIGDDLASAYVRTNITWAARNVGSPPLTDEQVEAVEIVGSVAAEEGMWVERRFPAGTMWFANNHTMFHMRTEFTDFDDPALKRHLLRIWLSLPNGRALPESFRPFFTDTSAGAARGGYLSRNDEFVFTTG